MNALRTSLVLLLAACAPSAHLSAASGAAISPGSPPALRPGVASVIDVSDPLDVSFCGLPTLPSARCFETAAQDGGTP